jgi:hypothetical protein
MLVFGKDGVGVGGKKLLEERLWTFLKKVRTTQGFYKVVIANKVIGYLDLYLSFGFCMSKFASI